MLLEAGHTVITTVRTEEKAGQIRAAHSGPVSEGRLEVAIVPDISVPTAFDEVVKTPGIDYVLHTASPFHYKWEDGTAQTSLIDPAINGTTGILKAIHASAPSVKRVVITSSFASIMNEHLMKDGNIVYSESIWNPVTIDQINNSKATAYRASKKLAEKAAWDFVETNKPNFDLATICPPVVFGPVAHHIDSLANINTSNERLVALVRGGWKSEIPPEGVYFWVDVRDVAKAHIQATLLPEASGKRFFTTAGYFYHRKVVSAVATNFPVLKDKLPAEDVKGGVLPPKAELPQYDNSRATKVLGIDWITLEKSIVDTIKSLDSIEKIGI